MKAFWKNCQFSSTHNTQELLLSQMKSKYFDIHERDE